MLIGLVFGILNGVLVSYLKLPPLIATLATSSVASGGLIMLLGTREFTTLPPSLEAVYSVNLLTYVDPNTGFNYPLTALFLVPVILCIDSGTGNEIYHAWTRNLCDWWRQ